MSATYSWPVESMSMAYGVLNWLIPDPDVPHFVTNVREEVSSNCWIRLLPLSTTSICPELSKAMSRGRLNWPSPDPWMPAWQLLVHVWDAFDPSSTPQPHMRMKLPVGENSWMR